MRQPVRQHGKPFTGSIGSPTNGRMGCLLQLRSPVMGSRALRAVVRECGGQTTRLPCQRNDASKSPP
jgi:hypothetical protein